MLYLEYIWLDSNNNCRSKTKITNINGESIGISDLPEWNYDGSSTGQATTNTSEVILKPVKMVRDPFRIKLLSDEMSINFLVLCETYNTDGSPHLTNHRYNSKIIFEMNSNHSDPMFGIEQEFFISRLSANRLVPIGFPTNQYFHAL